MSVIEKDTNLFYDINDNRCIDSSTIIEFDEQEEDGFKYIVGFIGRKFKDNFSDL